MHMTFYYFITFDQISTGQKHLVACGLATDLEITESTNPVFYVNC